ncbi:hypothetical protein M885DRAFT_505422 [Pelagophyceae sp. CCMP2097]|nr:hypothetical protein M885DRAFT_505422 [Pelagophyceae sp. CCMP2097]
MALRALGQDMAIGGFLCGCGDIFAQWLTRYRGHNGKPDVEKDTFDARRTAAMASYGFCAAVPYHFWYLYLARRRPGFSIVTKTALETFLVMPFFEIPAVVTWTGVLGRDQTFLQAAKQLERDWLPAVKCSTLIWIPASAITFSLVPSRWHLTIFYFVGTFWDATISLISFSGPGHGAVFPGPLD